jgi:flagellar hook protein FlgE
MTTIQSSFITGVQALLAQSQGLQNISTNIANVNTNGYKEQQTQFATLLDTTAPVDQKFFTVQSIDSRNVDKQGTIATTGRTLDLALNGRGFIVTNTAPDASGTWQYTRDGSFYGKAVTLPTSSNGSGQADQGTLLTTSNGNYVYGWAADANGNFSQANDLKTLTPVMYSNTSVNPAKETTTVSLQANVAAAIPGRQPVGLPFIDANGSSRTLTVGFNLTSGSNWTLDMSSTDTNNQPVSVSFSPGTVSFDANGKLTNPPGGLVSVTVNDATGPQTLSLDLSKVTQYGGDQSLTVQNITQDGYIQGRLQNTYFDTNGVLIGSYSNGQTQNLFKLPVAVFQADQNLDAVPGNMFTQTAEAGTLQLNSVGNPISGGTQFVTGSVETSNVDLADQFSKMIVTQRAYSSAATVVRTADEMTQAARDLKN